MIFFSLWLRTLAMVCACVGVWASEGALLCLLTQKAQALSPAQEACDHLAAGWPQAVSGASNSPPAPPPA